MPLNVSSSVAKILVGVEMTALIVWSAADRLGLQYGRLVTCCISWASCSLTQPQCVQGYNGTNGLNGVNGTSGELKPPVVLKLHGPHHVHTCWSWPMLVIEARACCLGFSLARLKEALVHRSDWVNRIGRPQRPDRSPGCVPCLHTYMKLQTLSLSG